jgi:hypothetical protein
LVFTDDEDGVVAAEEEVGEASANNVRKETQIPIRLLRDSSFSFRFSFI